MTASRSSLTQLRRSWMVTTASFVALLGASFLFVDNICQGDDSPKDEAIEFVDAGKPTRDGSDWPVFLGPQGTGVSNEVGLLESWPAAGPPVLWERGIGTGYSSPSILGNRLVVHHRPKRGNDADKEVVECLRADNGKPVWKQSYPTAYEDPYGYNNGPRCTPLLDGSRCFTLGAEGKLYCFNIENGSPIWSRDLKEKFEIPDGFFGVSCTPILEGDRLIVFVGGQPNSGVVAFNSQTGEILWESVGQSTWDGIDTRGEWNKKTYKWTGEEQIASYASPIGATFHGKRHILCLMRHGLVSVDPENGKENFKYWFRSRKYESVNAARPVVVGNQIFISAAYQVGSALLEVQPDGKSVKEVWRNRKNMLTHWSTTIACDGYLYGFSGRHEQEGSFRCLELATGDVVWETLGYDGELSELTQNRQTGEIRNRETGQPVPFPFFGRGSKIQVGNKFIVLGERGTLALVKVSSKKFEEISRTSYKSINYPAWAAPVLSRQRLYLRSERSLLCLDLAAKP